MTEELDPLRSEVLDQSLLEGGAHRSLDLVLDRGTRLVVGPLPLLARVSELEPIARSQGGGSVIPRPAAVLEADRPAAPQVAVDRGLGIDRDVLVQRRPSLLRDVPGELTLGLIAGGGGGGGDALGGRRPGAVGP